MVRFADESAISIRAVTKGYGSLLAVDGISLEMMVGMRIPTAGPRVGTVESPCKQS
ncbi:MAG: hypothetical protein K0R39_1399 [Symbiobacteriaceae bacterium]|jgi:hypothetical protein|nr:hypothetical protein [Symbiobacteriaceae bacterium]